MNLSNSSFLCLDIGTYGVRGIAHCVRNAKIISSAMHCVNNPNTLFALNSVLDELEQKLNTHFNQAYITGNFGDANFQKMRQITNWRDEHKITEYDVKSQANKFMPPEDFYTMHVIPVFYGTPSKPNLVPTPFGEIDHQLKSIFSIISYEKDRTQYISELLRNAHIQSIGFYDPSFLQNAIFNKDGEKILLLDLGAQYTTVSLWTNRGPMFLSKIKMGQTQLTNALALGLRLNTADADVLKISASTTVATDMDRFALVAQNGFFSKFLRVDVNDIFIPKIQELVNLIKTELTPHIEKHGADKIILTGGGANIDKIEKLIMDTFNLPVENHGDCATLNALSDYIWELNETERNKYIQKELKTKKRINKIIKIFPKKKVIKPKTFIPIMPSSLCFDMNDNATYSLFASGGISMIHVDIMDGFFVDKIVGGVKELSNIRTHTNAHLHVHLMAESPAILAPDIINAGADTIILSFETSGIHSAIKIIKSCGKRCGLAVKPETPITKIKDLLPFIDEIMIMSVNPGAAGQEFDESVLQKIKSLKYTKQKHKLKYIISVDGGINPDTAKMCWDAGADLLVSGSYLANAPDFSLAVRSLLKR